MVRSVVYLIILSILLFIPFEINSKIEQKNLLKPSKSTQAIAIKIVQPTVEKKEPPKIKKPKPKPKKIIKKKVIKKKKIIKPVPTPIPEKKIIEQKPEPIVEKKESVVVEEPEPEIVETPPVQATKKQPDTSEADAYYALIYETINKNKYYPKKSRKFKQEDTIPVFFIIDKNGVVSGFRILDESQYRELNKAVKKMFKKMRRFAKPPEGVETPLEISIDINFKLER